MNFIPPTLTLSEAIQQIERWAYETVKDEKGRAVRIDGEVARLPVPSKVKEHLEALYDQMELDDWLALADGFKEIALGKAFEQKRRKGRPPGPDYGLGSTERSRRERERAKALGVWHTKYPDGCTECNRTTYKHASGGICSHCRGVLREQGLSIKEYRALKAAAEREVTSGNAK